MSPEIPLVVELIPNELVIVPASLELITTDGVVSFDGVLTTVSSLSVGAAVSIVIVLLPKIDPATGSVVLVIAFPAVSATVPIAKLLTVKPALVSPDPTV